MQNSPLLTIAIPTWNRAEFLRKNLEQLKSELSTIPLGIVEVIVSDNCSEDATQAVVEQAKQSIVSIQYVRNEKNIGWGANFCQCIDLAKGRYVLLLGDDDLLVDGALALLVSRVANKNYGVVCLRPYGFDSDFRLEYPGSFGDERVFDDANAFLVSIGALMSMISACVINKEVLRDVVLKDFFSSDLAHLNLVLHAALKSSENLFINKYMVACKRDNSSNYDFAEVFVDQFWNILNSHKNIGFDNRALSKIETRMLFSYYPFYLFSLRLENFGNNEEIFRRFKERFQHSLLFRIWLAPIIIFPRRLAICWGAGATLIGRVYDGDFRRGLAFLKRRILKYF